jgi:hypothetical protein
MTLSYSITFIGRAGGRERDASRLPRTSARILYTQSEPGQMVGFVLMMFLDTALG